MLFKAIIYTKKIVKTYLLEYIEDRDVIQKVKNDQQYILNESLL